MRGFHTGNPLRSEQVDILCTHSVVIHLMTAAVTNIKMAVMLAVFLVNASASRAALARVGSRDFKHERFVCKSLVNKFLLEVVECPRTEFSLAFLYAFEVLLVKRNIRQVFDNEERVRTIMRNECLGDLMVDVGIQRFSRFSMVRILRLEDLVFFI